MMKYVANRTCPIHNLSHSFDPAESYLLGFCANNDCEAPLLVSDPDVITIHVKRASEPERATMSSYCSDECWDRDR